jgi:hypothetical protein
LILAEGEGAEAVLDMAKSAPQGFFSRATILFTPGGSPGRALEDKLNALKPQAFWMLPTTATAMFRLKGVLTTATMGMRLYVTGTEPFIGDAVQASMEAGIDFRSVRSEHRGSAKRRVQCVHCKGFTDDVTVSPVVCAHCGLSLFVRDHFSRRLGAFQGVCIDAEVPGEVPAAEELYK